MLLSPLVMAGPWLAAVDLDVHRLPDRVLRPVGVASLLAVVVVSVAAHRGEVLMLATLGALLAGGGYLFFYLLGGCALGLGDVKLAGVIGLPVGAMGLGVLWWALMLSSLMCLMWFVAVRHREQRRARVAFGPWMLLGSLAAVTVFGA